MVRFKAYQVQGENGLLEFWQVQIRLAIVRKIVSIYQNTPWTPTQRFKTIGPLDNRISYLLRNPVGIYLRGRLLR